MTASALCQGARATLYCYEILKRTAKRLFNFRAADCRKEIETEMSQTSASPTYEERPWGSFTVLDEGAGYKVKRLEVLPGKRLSYQKHKRRQEHWMVVAGEATVTLNGEELTVPLGETIDIPLGAAHRISNFGA